MSALLTGNLPLIADAPDGIRKLRGLILELAVRGKLVPQDSEDEPAEELLKRIAAEKSLLASKGVIKKEGALPGSAKSECPFEIPSSWKWTRLSNVLTKLTDGTHHSPPNLTRGEYKYISAKNIKPWGIDLTEITYVTNEIHREIYARCNPEFGDVLYIKDGATTGVVTINTLKEPFSMLSSVALMKPSVGLFNRYLVHFLASPSFYAEVRSGMTGVAITRVTLSKLGAAPFALPPLAEQHRIVAKVDELMALCDRLETEQADAEAAHARLVDALLAALTRSTDAADFAAKWQRLAAHFDTLFTTEAAIDALKQTVLQLAVMGKLVPQDPNDEPASELLERIAAKRARLEAEGGYRKSKPQLPVSDGDRPYELPQGWCWQRLDDVLLVSGGLTLGRKFVGGQLVSKPYLRVANVQRGGLMLDQIKTTEVPEQEVAKYLLRSGDLLITEGGDWDKVGRTATWNNEINDCLHQNHVFRARPLSPEWNGRWTEMYLNAIPARSYFAASAKQTTNLASINMTQLKACPFPVPPLAEQHRIVAKVDELMALCDLLKAGLAFARENRARLADALVHTALQAA